MTVTRNAQGQLLRGSQLSRKRDRKALEALIDKWCGGDAESAVRFLAGVVKGSEHMPARTPGPNEDAASAALIPRVEPTIKERITAAEILLAYRWGAPGKLDSGGDEGSGAPAYPTGNPSGELDFTEFSDEELAQLEDLAKKGLRERGIIDGEVISTVQPAP